MKLESSRQSINDLEKTSRRLLKLDPNHFEALISLAESNFYKAKYPESRKALSKAEKVNPADKRIISLKKKLQGK